MRLLLAQSYWGHWVQIEELANRPLALIISNRRIAHSRTLSYIQQGETHSSTRKGTIASFCFLVDTTSMFFEDSEKCKYKVEVYMGDSPHIFTLNLIWQRINFVFCFKIRKFFIFLQILNNF